MAEIDVIKQVFTKVGYDIKEEQLMAIKEFVSGNDVFICLPTGYGKSLIYAALPDIFDEIRGRQGSFYWTRSIIWTSVFHKC